MPKNNLGLTSKIIQFIFEDIILYYEREIATNPKGFKKADPMFSSFLRTLNAEFSYHEGDNHIVAPYKRESKTFFAIKPVNKDSKRLSILASFFAHLRNSFAHGHFSVELINGKRYLCMEDKYTNGRKKGELSMVAQLPVEKLRPLVELLKQIKK